MDIIDLQRIRDEIGTSPDDDTIEEIHAAIRARVAPLLPGVGEAAS